MAEFSKGDQVLTVQPEREPPGYLPEARANNQWGVHGVVSNLSNGHGLCYQVRHEDGSMGWYEPSELLAADNLWSQLRGDL